ncbi:MAG: cob(I)yrinic acid a,c-diamide adenosyltransferase [Methyloligellaceae bacterium]
MVVLNKIYTRTGDKGTTALGTGERVAKTDLRIEAYGTVDETNSVIGLARYHLKDEIEYQLVDDMLGRIQNDMFDLGADLCIPDRGEKPEFEPLRVSDAQVKRLEEEIDILNADLEPLRSFILPGGSGAATALHMARTISRRAERCMVALASQDNEPVSEAALKYINRLSDFFFVAGRYVNKKGEQDVLWEPGKNH